MRRLFLHINVSADGYICDAAGDIDWHFADEEFQRYLDELLPQGRTTPDAHAPRSP